MTAITVVGDALLDLDWIGSVARVTPDAPAPVLDAAREQRRAGGAGLAATLAKAMAPDTTVTLVTALGDDTEGATVRAELDRAGVELVDLGLAGKTPVKLRLRAGGSSVARVDWNCATNAAVGPWSDTATQAVLDADAVLVSDYGRGMAALPVLSALLQSRTDGPPVVWDPHPRGPRPPRGTLDLLTPNQAEARQLAGGDDPGGDGMVAALRLAARTSQTFDCAAVVTVGARGAALAEPGREPLAVPCAPAHGDACGAGDRFAATVAVERARGTSREDAVGRAVESARQHVLGRTPAGALGDPVALARQVQSEGGTVVAAGGCFDVFHAGHLRLLESARSLGDCLIVCVNGDLSVRRLKGRGRPVNPIADRVAVLAGLSCVDGVAVFEETTPCEVLRELRPQIFVKGADHADGDLPERGVLDQWGGELVFLPLLEGRSTTRILDLAAAVG